MHRPQESLVSNMLAQRDGAQPRQVSGMDPFLLSFKHPDLESRYQTYHAENMRSLDVRTSLMATITYAAVLCKTYEMQAHWSPGSWWWAVVHTLVLAPAPAVWSLAHRSSWGRWRRLWCALFVPYSFLMARLVTRTLHYNAGVPATPFFFWNALSYSNIGWQLVLGLCYRLPFTYHLPTHAAALGVIQLQNSDWCRWATAASPDALGTLRRVVPRFSNLASLAPVPSATSASSLDMLNQRYCQVALRFGQLYLGLGLSSYVVWVLERQSRHLFLLQMARGTASVPVPSIWKKVRGAKVLCFVLAAPIVWAVVEAPTLLESGALGMGAAGGGNQ